MILSTLTLNQLSIFEWVASLGAVFFLAVIGKRFASGGLRDVIIEAGLVGPGTVESLLKGKHYNYGIRVIKIVSEALFRLKVDVFKECLIERGNEAVLHLIFEFSRNDTAYS